MKIFAVIRKHSNLSYPLITSTRLRKMLLTPKVASGEVAFPAGKDDSADSASLKWIVR
jgi:hypothetical protein